MQVHTDINSLPGFVKAVVTIGSFDGVHSGHRQILQQLKAEAMAVGGQTVIITFDPHPRMVVQAGQPVNLLTTLPEKIALLRQQGIDHLVIVPFNAAFAALSATAYVQDFLVAKFAPHTIITGYDHQFGHNREGNYQLLETLGPVYGFAVKEIPAHVLQDITISSTNIRQALLAGDCDTANRFLGYAYAFSGIVVKGRQLGRTIGYPTANLQITDAGKLVPGNGVYAVWVTLTDGSLVKGMMNIGNRPTVDGSKRTIEVHLLKVDKDLYGETLTVALQHRLRAEQKFDGLEALKAQLAKDKEAAIQVLQDL